MLRSNELTTKQKIEKVLELATFPEQAPILTGLKDQAVDALLEIVREEKRKVRSEERKEVSKLMKMGLEALENQSQENSK